MPFYIFKNNVQSGPFEESAVRAQIQAGQLSAADLAIRQGDAGWRPLGEVMPDAFRAKQHPLPPQAPPIQPPPQYQQPQPAANINAPAPMNKKMAVGIYVFSAIAFLIGTLIAGIGLLLMIERVINEPTAFAFFGVGALCYLVFILVSTVFNFYTLARMYGAIQDGVSTSVGKAIGFLFIPIFSIYWVFKVWGGYPTEYNSYLERHGLKAPPVTSGIFTAFPVMMLLTGILVFPLLILPFVFAKVIARTADAVNNLRLAIEYRNAGNAGPLPEWHTDETSRADFRTWKLAGLAGAGLLSLLLVGFAGFAFWRLNPAVPAGMFPETAGKFKLQKTYQKKGSIFGTTQLFSAAYEPSDGGRKSLVGYVVEYTPNDPSGYITDYCSKGPGRYGDVQDSSGKPFGKYSLCEGEMRFSIDKRLVKIGDLSRSSLSYEAGFPWSSDLKGYTPVTDDELFEFTKGLTFEPAVVFAQKTATKGPSPSSTPVTSTPKPEAPAPTATDAADFTGPADVFLPEWKKGKSSKYAGKIVQISGRVDNSTGSVYFRPEEESMRLEMSDSQSTSALKPGEMATFKCRAEAGYGNLDLKRCLFIGSKGPINATEPADFTFTAADFYSKYEDYNKPTAPRMAAKKKMSGKLIEISGTVIKISGESHFLKAGERDFVTCYEDDENKSQFAALTEGQPAKFRGVMSLGSLKHCIVVR